LPGQLNASLTSFSRTIDEYNKLAKQELVPAKQEKAYERVKNFRAELAEYRQQFDRLKQEADERVCVPPIPSLQHISTLSVPLVGHPLSLAT
jgi:Golgi SNAP receptor complex protein 2